MNAITLAVILCDSGVYKSTNFGIRAIHGWSRDNRTVLAGGLIQHGS
jgi:hypothetical protein